MIYEVPIVGKTMDLSVLTGVVVSGDNNADTVRLVMDKLYGDTDMSAYAYGIKAQNSLGTVVTQLLTKTTDAARPTKILFDWKVESQFTDVAGLMDVWLYTESTSFSWNTMPATFRVAKGLSVAESTDIGEQYLTQFMTLSATTEGYKNDASASATTASEKATSAYDSAASAESSASAASASATAASGSKTDAASSATSAAASASDAFTYKNQAQAIKDSTEMQYNVGADYVEFKRADETTFKRTGSLIGPTGPTGATGQTGPTGPIGVTPNITIGTVTTGATGVPAAASLTGTLAAPVLNLTLPKGNTGNQGPIGATGIQGPAGTMQIGTVTTGAAGTSAAVSNVGTSSAAILNFQIPQGIQGIKGEKGDGLQVSGYYQTLAALQTAYPNGNGNAIYWVGQYLYAWSGSAWVSQGQLKGDQGETGQSAYQAAVAAGFVGTITEWLASLKGQNGANGNDGTAATIDIGTVTTGSPNTDVIIENKGTANAAIFDFTIPRGVAGTTAYQAALNGGMQNTVSELVFNTALATVPTHVADSQKHTTEAEKTKLALMDTDGDGTKCLTNDGTYKSYAVSVPIATPDVAGRVKASASVQVATDGTMSVPLATMMSNYIFVDTWTARSAAEANIWKSVCYGNGLFVAVSADGTNRVMTSPDGITWTARSAAEANIWQSVCFGNGLFVAVAYTGTNRVMTSPDGITWTARSATEANTWYSVCYGNGLFVAVSADGTHRVMTSPDGITWTARSADLYDWRSVCYGNGLFVAVSADGTNRVMTSPDGITWTARSAAEANSWYYVCHGNGLFVAVAGNGTNRVMTSPDGITWTARAAAEANSWQSVCFGNGLFVAVAYTGTHRVMTSPDGITWTARSADLYDWRSVCYGNGLFVAVGTTGNVMTSLGQKVLSPGAMLQTKTTATSILCPTNTKTTTGTLYADKSFTLGSPASGMSNDWEINFKTGSTVYGVTFATAAGVEIKWPNDTAPTYAANKAYKIIISEDDGAYHGVFQGWSL